MSKRLVSSTFVLAALTILPAIAAAQSPVTTFGLKGGITNANLSVDDSLDLDTKSVWGAAGGLFIGGNLTDRLGLQAEVLLTQKGAKLDVLDLSTKTRLTYLDVPVTVRLGNTMNNNAHFHVFTGPQLGIKIKARNISDAGDFDIGGDVKSTDIGWTLGAGFETGPFILDARYTLGLTNIAVADSDGSTKNRAFMVLAGYRFR